ncbi:MAG: phasin family protein [Proteobacteria bacterium]|nr:phasin family protein [Pseudomonadota bacterium]
MAQPKTKAADAANDAFKHVEALAAAGKGTVETAIKAGTAAATKHYEQALQLTSEQVAKASETLFKGYDELNALSKDNYEALVKSGTIVAKAMEDLGKEWVSFTQASVEQSVAAVQGLMAAKTLREFVELQNDWAKKSFDAAVVETTKFSELSVKTTNEAIEPIQARMNVTVERMFKQIAA